MKQLCTVWMFFVPSSRSLLESHLDCHRDLKFSNIYRCRDCKRVYVTRNGFLKHRRLGTCYKRDVFHDDGTQGEYQCDVCKVRFFSDGLLALHKEKVSVTFVCL